MSKINVEQLASIAQEFEITDPIDWGMLNISEDGAYKLMASHVIEMYQDNTEPEILMAIVTKLLVENFVLNLKLLGKQ